MDATIGALLYKVRVLRKVILLAMLQHKETPFVEQLMLKDKVG